MVLHLVVLELVRRLRLRLRGRRHAEDVPKHGARARHVEPVVHDCEGAQPARVGVQQPREERVADRLERSALLQDGVGRHSSPREVEGVVRRLVPVRSCSCQQALLAAAPAPSSLAGCLSNPPASCGHGLWGVPHAVVMTNGLGAGERSYSRIASSSRAATCAGGPSTAWPPAGTTIAWYPPGGTCGGRCGTIWCAVEGSSADGSAGPTRLPKKRSWQRHEPPRPEKTPSR
mmetsp:Transcript_15331/g.48975  ORF Transcript_15331/g.48975 Transcript_15331/m.48975 type:complete len:231 (+) Transcript_15331:455-1147(+)